MGLYMDETETRREKKREYGRQFVSMQVLESMRRRLKNRKNGREHVIGTK